VSRDYEEVLIEGRRYNQVSKLTAVELTVTQNKLELGKIGTDFHIEPRYTVTNPRIRSQRSRGSVTKTKDLKKALALVKKMFFPKTPKEIAKEYKETIESSLDSFKRTHRYAFNESWNRLGGSIQAYVADTIDAFLPYVTNPANLAMAKELGERIHNRDMSFAFVEKYEQHDASAIVIVGETYFVTNRDQPAFEVDRDKLPDTVRTKIGILSRYRVEV
jgi:hypothetical protein